MLSSSSGPVTMTTPTRPTVRTALVPPPLSMSQSLSLPLDDGSPAMLSPTPSASYPISPREPKSPPPASAPTPTALAPPTPIPSYMQATKSFAGRSPQPPSTPTRTNSVSTSVVSSSGSTSKRTARSTTRAADRSRSRPRAANTASTFTLASDSPTLPTLAPPPPPPQPDTPTPAASSSLPPPPPAAATGDFPCASCRAHYSSSSSTTTTTTTPAWTTAAHNPHKLHRYLLDLQITNDTLAVLNADLQAIVAQQARFIAQLEEHVARLAGKVGKEEAELVAHLHEEEEEEVKVEEVAGWYEPVSEDKIQDHHKLLARMCDRTHRMLFDARRAVNQNRGDMESVSVDDDDDGASVTSVEFGDEDEDDEVSEIEADVVPKIIMPARTAGAAGVRGRQLSTSSSIVSSSTTASSMGGGQLHSLVKSLAYHIHLLDSTPPPATDLLSPTTRRTSSSTVSSPRLTARSPSPLSLTRTPSGFGVLGLGAVLDLAPPHHTPSLAGSATAAAARKHQLEQCLVIQRCKDTVMQLCAETGVPMGEVREMVVDAQMHVATSSMPGSPTTVTSASRLASPAVASRHPSSYQRASVDKDEMVDIRSDASSTRSNYSRVSSSRSFMSSEGGGGGTGRSSVLGPNASASALGRPAGGGMVYPAGMSLEEKYRMHMAYQQATQGGGSGRAGPPRVVLQQDDAEDAGTAPPRSLVSGSGGGAASSCLSSPTLLPDSTSLVSGVSGGRVVRIKHADTGASVVSGGGSSCAPSVSSASASGTGTPSRVASVLSGFISSSPSGAGIRVNGGSEAGAGEEGSSPQGSSAGRPRGPASMVARAIKVRTWMG